MWEIENKLTRPVLENKGGGPEMGIAEMVMGVEKSDGRE